MWILLLMIAIMPFEENPYLLLAGNLFGVFPRFTAIKLVGLVGLAWSGVQLSSGRVPPAALDSAQSRAFLAFLATVAFGGIASGAGIQPVTRLIAIIGLLPLVVTAVRSGRDLRRVVLACALVTVAVFPYAYRQMLRFGGRLGVGLYESNYYALILTLLLPLPLVLARGSSGQRRLLWLGAAALITLQLVLTGSRGGFLALILTLGLLAFRLPRNPLPALTAGAVVLLLLLVMVPNPMTHRLLASGLSDDVSDAGVEFSNEQRRRMLQGGLRMVADHPFTGVGLGNFKTAVPDYVELDKSQIAHNTYLEVAAELGLPVLATFCLVVLATLRSLERSARLARRAGDRTLHDLALGLQAGLAGYLLGALFLSAQYEKFFWLVMFLSISVEQIARRKARAARRKAMEPAA